MRALLTSALACSLLVGCGMDMQNDDVTREEAQEAIDSANIASSAQALTYDVVEISTRFTLGKAAREAAMELRDFAKSQIPCSTITVEEARVTIDFGTLEDNCTYRGRTYAGVVQLDIQRASGELLVHHTWRELTNGAVTVSGEADVTWSRAEASRHVEYDMDFMDMARKKGPLHATGDVTQKLLDPAQGLSAGIEVDGSREWSLEDGRSWTLAIEGVEMRGQDPVPQAGSYVLTTPKDKTLSMSFERVSPTKIRVTITGKRGRKLEVDVTSIE